MNERQRMQSTMDQDSEQNTRQRAEARMLRLREFLFKEIGDGKFAANRRLPTERDLAARFQVARHTVRRTLRQLESEGRIVRQVGRGTFVTEGYAAIDRYKNIALDVASPTQVTEVRLLLEPRIAHAAAGRGTIQDFAHVSETVVEGMRVKNFAEFREWDISFHQAIVACTKNEFLAKLYEAISTVRRETPWVQLKPSSFTPERMSNYMQEHELILNALKSRDAEGASEAMWKHLRHVLDDLLG